MTMMNLPVNFVTS